MHPPVPTSARLKLTNHMRQARFRRQPGTEVTSCAETRTPPFATVLIPQRAGRYSSSYDAAWRRLRLALLELDQARGQRNGLRQACAMGELRRYHNFGFD